MAEGRGGLQILSETIKSVWGYVIYPFKVVWAMMKRIYRESVSSEASFAASQSWGQSEALAKRVLLRHVD